jgi:hypothetical protein
VGKKSKRPILKPPGPENLAARAAGKVITVLRFDAIARLLDTAILLWFLERDPLPIHLLLMAPYQCLDDMGKKSGKGPRLKGWIGEDHFVTAYDFLRHASSNPNSGIDFPPSANAPILFDAVAAFDRIFGKLTIYMRSFRAFFVLHPDHPDPDVAKRMLERAGEFLPENITVEEAMKLGRIEFFTKLTEMFATQYRA